MIALVDESIAASGQGVYVIAAVVIGQDGKEMVRRRIRRVMPGPGLRFHFHHESASTRLGMLGLLGEVAAHVFAYRVVPAPKRNEAARDRCLHAMLSDLESIRVSELVLESRQAHNDARDRRLIARFGGLGGVEYCHRRPQEEPLLWLADALAGAVLADVKRERRWIQALPSNFLVVRENP